MAADTQEFVQKCHQCVRGKTPNSWEVPIAQTFEHSRPLELVSLDIVGPLPTTRKGNKYLLTFIDHFTCYAEGILLPDQTAESTVKAFVKEIVTCHCMPDHILTDQG